MDLDYMFNRIYLPVLLLEVVAIVIVTLLWLTNLI